MNGKNKIICKLFVILFISLFISCGDSFSSVEKTSVTIRQFESYSITDMDDLDVAFLYSGTTSDSAVAVLREGKYIYGNGIGTADITVTDGNIETVYNVTVTQNPEHNLQPAISDSRAEDDDELTQEDCYIGYCYNAFSGEEFDQSCVRYLEKVFDWNKIIENQNYFIMDDTPSVIRNSFSAGSSQEFMNSYKKELSASVSVKFLGKKLYSKNWSEQTSAQSSSSSSKEINNVYLCLSHDGFYLNDDGEGYWKYLLPEVKYVLQNHSAEDFIRYYGTHVVLGTRFGQSFKLNYTVGDGLEFKPALLYEKNPTTGENYFFPLPFLVDSKTYNDFFLNYEQFKYSLQNYGRTYGINMEKRALSLKEVLRGEILQIELSQEAERIARSLGLENVYKDAYNITKNITRVDILRRFYLERNVHSFFHFYDIGSDSVVVIGGPQKDDFYPVELNEEIDSYNGFYCKRNIECVDVRNAYTWLFYLSIDNRECDRLVGPWDEHSLMPIWEIIPDDLDWAAAKKAEFEEYVNSHVER